MYKTFNGWKQVGRVVMQGQRGVYRNEYGDMMFHRNQTKKRSVVVTHDFDRNGHLIRETVRYV